MASVNMEKSINFWMGERDDGPFAALHQKINS
ncbi:MAG: hypothetical protein GPOALKHO_001301 [Sodalis sp.]|nr:MAG: hypothetical protein GPOALKHO_001301 [Sodalis sp.]